MWWTPYSTGWSERSGWPWVRESSCIRRAGRPRARPRRPIGRVSEVDDPLGALGDLVEVVGPDAGREILPAAVADDGDDHTLVDLAGAAGGGGHDGARRDPGEDSDLSQAAGPFDA